MKYLKTFETIFSGVYYKIFIDGSIDKFIIALNKLGYYEEFCKDWIIYDWNYIQEDSIQYFNKKTTYLLIGKHYSGKPMFIVRSEDSEFDGEYLGEIHIEDCEVDAVKYNI